MKTTVLFDLDGTLVDSLDFIIKNYRLVFNKMGLSWADGEVARWIGRPLIDIAAFFAGGREKEFVELYGHHYNKDYKRHVKPFPGTLEMLKYLKKEGLQLGIVTSKGRDGTRRTVEAASLQEYMDVIVTAQDVSKHKPFPDPVIEALNRLRSSPRESLYVGDSPFDIQAGMTAGTLTLGVTWGISTAEELIALKPDGLLETWDGLTRYLE